MGTGLQHTKSSCFEPIEAFKATKPVCLHLKSIDIQEIVVSELSSIVQAWPISLMECKMLRIPMQLSKNGFFLCHLFVLARLLNDH
jgi:hypothetical protein